LPQLQNSSREPLSRERKQGLAVSAVIHILLAILILLVTFRVKIPEPSEEGLLVNFGFDQTGDGLFEPAPLPSSPPPPPPSAGAEAEAAEEAILTQEFEEAVEVKKKEPSPEELRRQAEARAAELKRREEAEAERRRIEQETAERLRREEEQRRIDQANARVRGALSNTGNTGTTGQSEGVAGGAGNQGTPTGTPGAPNYGPGGGQGNSPTYSLDGRSAQSLPHPVYDIQVEGKVVVEVTVDKSGKVINAVAGRPGSTTLDATLLRIAREAALKARFNSSSEAPEIQKGTITYNFKLN